MKGEENVVGYDPAGYASGLLAPQKACGRYVRQAPNRGEPKRQSSAKDCNEAFHATGFGSREHKLSAPILLLPLADRRILLF
jgi:hypothetical protein